MRIYLVQHGDTKSKDIDPSRSLSSRGRKETRLMAEMAAKLELAIQQIRHSGKTRAEQTAAIFGEALAPRRGVVAISGINPMDDVQPIASALADEAEPIMLVGHLPFMARLAGLLVNGDPENAPVEFRNSGLLCLEQGDERWEARWHLTPG